ncbi:MAG TPA: hypothetical protein VGE98_05160, partial [Thermoanaerobaculia bacterium]
MGPSTAPKASSRFQRSRFGATLLVFLSFTTPVFAAAAAAPTKPAEKPRFSEVTDVVSIEVPVQVVKDGEPVRGLTAADFAVYEGRKQQSIVGFEVLDSNAAPAGAHVRPGAVPAAARRYFLLLFDLSFSEPK